MDLSLMVGAQDTAVENERQHVVPRPCDDTQSTTRSGLSLRTQTYKRSNGSSNP
jgi:hypothetical protein